MINGLIIFHVVICCVLTVVVLVQFGKGAEAGAMMGSGSSQAIFTSSSKGNFFTKLTTVLAILFMVNSVVLSTLTSKESESSLLDGEAPVAAPLNRDNEAPAATPTTDAGATPVAPEATTPPTKEEVNTLKSNEGQAKDKPVKNN